MKKVFNILFIISVFFLVVYLGWYFLSVRKADEIKTNELQYDIDFSQSFDGGISIQIDEDNLLYLLGEQLFPDSIVRGKIEGRNITLFVKSNFITWIRVDLYEMDGLLRVQKVSLSFIPLGKRYVNDINERIVVMYSKDSVFEDAEIQTIRLDDDRFEIILKASYDNDNN